MAVQSDETLVTKGDLKELYQDKILPYLGGNMMMATNVSDYYSTDEKIVGIWDDGKPLYQKNYHFTGAPIPANTWTSVADLSSLNTDICMFSGYCKNNTNGQILSIPYDDQGTYFAVQIEPTNKTLYVRTNYITNINGLYCVIIQYTKTTDTATSALTTPGCYDLNRPDLWPENKELFFGNGLYGKRYVGNTPAIASGSGTQILIDPDLTTANIINSGGYIQVTNSSNVHPRPTINTTACSSGGAIYFYSSIISTAQSGIALSYKITSDISWRTTTSDKYNVWITYTKG